MKAREAEDVFKDITSVVVLKNGKILIEEYFNKADRNMLHDVRSVGKTFASTITGIAIADGFLKNEYQTLKEFYNLENFANFSSEKANTTIKELLTMSSIFEGNDNKGNSAGREDNMYPTQDWVKFTLDLPTDTAYANGQWHYFTAGVVLLGDILHKSVAGGLEAYAHQKLFKPLGITNYKWQYTPQKVANTAGGIRMNALDFAKYAQLYKNRGKWNGKQVLPKEWVDKSFTKIKSIPGRENEFYGYLFWNKTYKVNGKEYETYYCAGNGGNHIYIFNELPIVVVVTGMAYNRPYAHPQVHKIMEDYVLPAVLKAK
jgi:CubicO group peptidase (beta-lactamase class C family)